MGEYRFVYTPSKARGGGGGDTTPPVESYDLGQKVRAAISTGFFVFVGFTVLMWVVLILAILGGYPPPWQAWPATAAVAAMIGTLVTCWFGFDWSKQAAIRPWEVDNVERARRHEIEDAQLEAQRAAALAAKDQVVRGDDTDGNPLTLTDQQRLDLVAINMLERAYMGKGAPTRDAMCGDGVCLQMEWNLVNAGMKAIKVRDKKSWAPLGFQEAWQLWRENVRLETATNGDRYLEVLKPNGKWFALERIE